MLVNHSSLFLSFFHLKDHLPFYAEEEVGFFPMNNVLQLYVFDAKSASMFLHEKKDFQCGASIFYLIAIKESKVGSDLQIFTAFLLFSLTYF